MRRREGYERRGWMSKQARRADTPGASRWQQPARGHAGESRSFLLNRETLLPAQNVHRCTLSLWKARKRNKDIHCYTMDIVDRSRVPGR